MTSTRPMTKPVLSSRTGKCKNFWSCISFSASRRVKSATTVSGLGVIIAESSRVSGFSPLAVTRDSRSLGVSIPTSFEFESMTRMPFLTEAISIEASLTVWVGNRRGILSSPIMVLSVGTDPPNMLSTRAFIASICTLLLPFLLLPPAAFMAFIIASLAADALVFSLMTLSGSPWTFSSTDIASYRHFAMSSNPTTAPVLSSTGKWRKRLSTIISKASSAESSSCTHFGFLVITESTQVARGSTNWDTTRLVMSLSVMMPAS